MSVSKLVFFTVKLKKAFCIPVLSFFKALQTVISRGYDTECDTKPIVECNIKQDKSDQVNHQSE